jgi:hypothetical protein
LHTEKLQHTNAKTISFFKMIFYGKPENFSRLRKFGFFFSRVLLEKNLDEILGPIVPPLGGFTWNVPSCICRIEMLVWLVPVERPWNVSHAFPCGFLYFVSGFFDGTLTIVSRHLKKLKRKKTTMASNWWH